MLDVHTPHEKIHGFWDFSLHLFTITIGLLIALSLESCVEWKHNRNLVHEAEAAIQGEIVSNAKGLPAVRQQINDQQKLLDKDLAALAIMRRQPKSYEKLSINFAMIGFDDVAWKTAQATGAFAYMPYGEAQELSSIYDTQDALYRVQQQIAEDSMSAAAPVINLSDKENVSPSRIDEVTDRIGLIKMRMLLLDSYVKALDGLYNKYEAGHPNK